MGDNRIAWSIVSQIATKAKLEDMKFRNAEWGPESHPNMINEVRNFSSPYGSHLGDLIDATPTESISRVFLEDKLFETWHHGRTVLIGDGKDTCAFVCTNRYKKNCLTSLDSFFFPVLLFTFHSAAHKLLPSSGQGANNAMEDAVILANCLYDVGSTSLPDVKVALKSFWEQRLPHVLEQYKASKASAKFLYGHVSSHRHPPPLLLPSLLSSSILLIQITHIPYERNHRPLLRDVSDMPSSIGSLKPR